MYYADTALIACMLNSPTSTKDNISAPEQELRGPASILRQILDNIGRDFSSAP